MVLTNLKADIHPNAVIRYCKVIDEVSQNPTEENVLLLADEIRTCARYMDHNNESNVALYAEIKRAFLELPNHLECLTQKIETERAKVANHGYHSGTRNSFNNMRVDIIRDTLCHLPSPATVAALGKYLSDERDTPPPELPGQDWGDALSNAYQACTALEKIGLRNAPIPPRSSQNESNLATWRLWWGQVEAGTRAFSFEGEVIEYRLRKDGTWETSALGSMSKSAMNSPTSATETKSPSSTSNRWWYVILGTFSGLAWLRWRKMRRRSKDILK